MLVFVLFGLISSVTNLVFKTAIPRNTPAIITHIGFILFLLGTLLTFSNSRTISVNTSNYDLGSARANAESLLLMRGDTMYMSGFYVSYVDNIQKGNLTEYRVDFMKRKDATYTREFSLYPSVNRNLRMGDVYNPATKRMLTKDYYTYISYASSQPDYIVINAIINPYINILWAGAIVMTIGFILAFRKRIRSREHSLPGSVADSPEKL
jgi:cytochrome c biogenesis factor